MKTLVLTGYGIALKTRKGMFQVIEKGKRVSEISPVELKTIVIGTKAISISSAAIILASKYGIDLVFLEKWKPISRLVPATYGSTLKTWIYQLIAIKNRRTIYAGKFAEGKIYNQRMILYWLYKKYTGTSIQSRIVRARIREAIEWAGKALQEIDEAQTIKEIRNLEAHTAKKYWKAVSKTIPKELGFKYRIKRYTLPKDEKKDPFNIALNIGYSVLLREVWRAVFMAGLNPYYGFLHVRRPGRMSLVLDLMEEFRPIVVDRPLIKMARKQPKIIKKLEKEDREAIATVWKTITETINKTPKPLKNIIQTQARKLAETFINKTTYTPYKSKW